MKTELVIFPFFYFSKQKASFSLLLQYSFFGLRFQINKGFHKLDEIGNTGRERLIRTRLIRSST